MVRMLVQGCGLPQMGMSGNNACAARGIEAPTDAIKVWISSRPHKAT
jgi:hypothetical protein